ncbi:MAG TPA: 16S rRNA (cytidine(1402)-2'-O)-methyltransferase [Acidimicrobiales bacterium]
MTGGGRLVLVGTPIGNMGDLAPRAAEALANADVVACEDTRHTGRLLQRAGISVPRLLSFHEHNEAARADEIIALLDDGQTIALVSDAGMPTVSDPGQRLVTAVGAAGHEVTAVPGPTAAVTALAVSGLPAERWVMEGFLPRQGRERSERMAAIAGEPRTTLIYESPRRLGRTLSDLLAVADHDRRVVVCRELTKLHEEVWRGALGDAVQRWAGVDVKGEVVVVVGPAVAEEVDDDEILAALTRARSDGLSARDAAARVSEDLAVARNRVYRMAIYT